MKNINSKKQGISLIMLVITIIVLAILSAAVIISISNTSLMTKARTTSFKSDMTSFKEAYSMWCAKKTAEINRLPGEGVNISYVSDAATFAEIFGSDISSEYISSLEIEDGRVIFFTEDEEKNSILSELNMLPNCYHTYLNGTCTKCSRECTHTYINGICANCGYYTLISTKVNGTNIPKAFLNTETIGLNRFFTLAQNATIVYNDSIVSNISDLPLGCWCLLYNRNLNRIEVVSEAASNPASYEEAHIRVIGASYNCAIPDLSGNSAHDLALNNGVALKKDAASKYYLDFDGVDDYASLTTLENDINWEGGFTIDFEAQWNTFNNWSRIFDFGNGQSSDNILVTNSETSSKLVFSVYNQSTSTDLTVYSSLSQNTTNTYQITYTKNATNQYTVTTKINGILVDTRGNTNTPRNILRTCNYLGRSNWSFDSYFNGRIYSLKITQANGDIILWYDVNEWLNLSND